MKVVQRKPRTSLCSWDSDTLACITGGIAEAYYGDIPVTVRQKVYEILTPELHEIVEAFCDQFR